MKTTKILGLLAVTILAIVTPSQAQLFAPPSTAPEVKAARETKQVVRNARDTILGIIQDGVGKTFGTSDHQAVIDALGVDAYPIVVYYEDLIAFALAMMTKDGDTTGLARLAQIMSRVPEYTKDDDEQTISIIIPEPTPTPTPEP